jgi:hypothetical protein
MIFVGGPVSKATAMQVAQAGTTQLGFRQPRAYGAWMERGYWNVSLKDMRGHTILAFVDPTSGRLLSASNRSRWPRDYSPVKATGRPPERKAALALMQKMVPVRLRTDRWSRSWADRVESYYRAYVGNRILIDDRGLVRPYLLQDPESGEPISFYSVLRIPKPFTLPDRIPRAEAERIAVATLRAHPSPKTPTVRPPLPALPALYMPKAGPAIPVWRVRVDSEFVGSHRRRLQQQDVLVNTQTGKVEAVVPRTGR